jgi:hypothetical protein
MQGKRNKPGNHSKGNLKSHQAQLHKAGQGAKKGGHAGVLKQRAAMTAKGTAATVALKSQLHPAGLSMLLASTQQELQERGCAKEARRLDRLAAVKPTGTATDPKPSCDLSVADKHLDAAHNVPQMPLQQQAQHQPSAPPAADVNSLIASWNLSQ